MILEIKNLNFSYNKNKKVLANINLSLEKSSILCILGINGAGKSTLLNNVMGLLKPDSGSILIDGTNIQSMNEKEIARIVGYVPQIHVPTYEYAVIDFVVMGRSPYLGMLQQPSNSDYQIARESLEILGIQYLENKLYTQISGGERQLVTIARALTQQPKILLFDEPTAHLDFGKQWRMIRLIKKLSGEGYAVVITTHTPDHAIALRDQVAILHQSGSMTFGNMSEIMTEDNLEKLYDEPLFLKYIDEIESETCLIKDR